MRTVFILIGFVFFSCNENKQEDKPKAIEKDTLNKPESIVQTDSINLIKSFRAFRDAVYQYNKAKVKEYIDFPILNYGNEIWHLVYLKNDKLDGELPEEIKPFTENDFDKYFNNLFTKKFVETLLKIKSEILFKDGRVETADFKDGNTTYKMYGTYEKKDRSLILNLSSNSVMKDENGEIMDGGESSIIYEFEILSNSEIKFKQIRLAG